LDGGGAEAGSFRWHARSIHGGDCASSRFKAVPPQDEPQGREGR
jgi:hypothetical protein